MKQQGLFRIVNTPFYAVSMESCPFLHSRSLLYNFIWKLISWIDNQMIKVPSMVNILDGSSEHVACLWIEMGKVICLKHLSKTTAGSSSKYVKKKYPFSYTRAPCVLSYHPNNICTNNKASSFTFLSYSTIWHLFMCINCA